MRRESKSLRWSLRQFGYSDATISAAWPSWWSDDAEGSASAQAELRFSVARKLGLDPRQLIDGDEPHFVWTDVAKYKNLSTESEREQSAIAAYGVSIGRMLLSAVSTSRSLEGAGAAKLRADILVTQPFVALADLLSLCWSVGIPVIHLRIFPLGAKHMCAMSIRIGDRAAILLGKDAEYPAPIAYYLAHELGHIAIGHLRRDAAAFVDFGDPLVESAGGDDEERAADRYALELLTGSPEPRVLTDAQRYSAEELARNVMMTGPQLHIEPGTLALCFGYSTSDWARTQAALKFVYPGAHPVWLEINRVARRQLEWETLSDDLAAFLGAVMGGLADDDRSD